MCLPFQNFFVCTSFLYIVQPFLFGRPRFVFPFISPNTNSFISLLSFVLQMCPNKFNFLSLILCMMFHLLPIIFLISNSFVIFLPSYIYNSSVASHRKCHQFVLVFFFNVHVSHACMHTYDLL